MTKSKRFDLMGHSMAGSELQDPDSDLRGSLARWAERMGCGLLLIFGSEALGRARRGSDLDLAISFDPLPTAEERLRIVGEIQDLCAARNADVVFLHPETDPVLRFEIFRDGEVLYECERGLFVEERVRALMLYEDALPFRRALRERLATQTDS